LKAAHLFISTHRLATIKGMYVNIFNFAVWQRSASKIAKLMLFV